MSGNITQPTGHDPEAFLRAVEHPRRREDALTLLASFKRWTGMNPVLWADGLAGKPGSAIIGYGHYHYRYTSGREGDWFLTGFSPRKQNLAIYIMPGFAGFADILKALGPHKHSVSCLYLTNLARNEPAALERLVRDSVEMMKARYEWRPS